MESISGIFFSVAQLLLTKVIPRKSKKTKFGAPADRIGNPELMDHRKDHPRIVWEKLEFSGFIGDDDG